MCRRRGLKDSLTPLQPVKGGGINGSVWGLTSVKVWTMLVWQGQYHKIYTHSSPSPTINCKIPGAHTKEDGEFQLA